ncbi:MAG: TIGR03086 family metal-binding protein [Acidimicrobiales bacterium]
MAPTSDVIFKRGLDQFGEVVDQVPGAAWDQPSRCEGWSNLDVLGHLSTALGMGAALLRGEQPTWPEADRPADLVAGEPVAFYRQAADACRHALEGADLDLEMDTPMGTRTVADRLAFPAIDLFVHAWDIGRAADLDVSIPDDVIEFAHGYLDPIPTEMMRGPGGAFGPEADVPPDATPSEAFLAWTGRPPH